MAGINIDVVVPILPDKNPISFLQEISQSHKFPSPVYKEASGNYNEFGSEVSIHFTSENPIKFYGIGRTKKLAKTKCAEMALEYLSKVEQEVFLPPPPLDINVDINMLSPMVRDLHLKNMPLPLSNSNKQTFTLQNASSLVKETEEVRHASLGLEVAQMIQKARQDKGYTQKALASKINEKPAVVIEYESGRVVPNMHILSKLERALGIRLHGPSAGKSFQERKK